MRISRVAQRCLVASLFASALIWIAAGTSVGATVPPDNPQAVAAQLKQWADDPSPLPAMGAAARTWAEQHHARNSAITAHAATLEQVLRRNIRQKQKM